MVYILLLLVGLILVVFCIYIFASWWPVVMGGSHSGIGLWLRRLW